MQAGNRKIEIVPGEGAVKGEAYMRDDFIDRKIRKMAEAERMAVPESLDAKVENILDGLETEKIVWRKSQKRSRRATMNM